MNPPKPHHFKRADWLVVVVERKERTTNNLLTCIYTTALAIVVLYRRWTRLWRNCEWEWNPVRRFYEPWLDDAIEINESRWKSSLLHSQHYLWLLHFIRCSTVLLWCSAKKHVLMDAVSHDSLYISGSCHTFSVIIIILEECPGNKGAPPNRTSCRLLIIKFHKKKAMIMVWWEQCNQCKVNAAFIMHTIWWGSVSNSVLSVAIRNECVSMQLPSRRNTIFITRKGRRYLFSLCLLDLSLLNRNPVDSWREEDTEKWTRTKKMRVGYG